ncbi:hypothetical protein ACVBEQ_05215 [Nakamurella sp. GG22]
MRRSDGVAPRFRGAGRVDAVFFRVQQRTLLQAGTNRPAEAATSPSIADAVTSPGTVAVAVNPAALRAMEDILRRGATAAIRDGGTGPARRPDRPVRRRRGDVLPGRRAHRRPGPQVRPRGRAEMLAPTYRDETGRGYSNQARDPFRAMLLAEETAVQALRHSYTSSAATAWKAAEKIGEAWDAATRTDPLLRHRHLRDGSVVRAQPTAAAPDGVDAVLSLPMRIKKGKVVVMPDDDHTADLAYATLTGLSMTGDDLTGWFSEQKGAVRSFAMLRDAAATHTTVLVTGEPFLGSTPRVYGGRRGSRSTPPMPPHAAPVAGRQVPLDVVLAGGG